MPTVIVFSRIASVPLSIRIRFSLESPNGPSKIIISLDCYVRPDQPYSEREVVFLSNKTRALKPMKSKVPTRRFQSTSILDAPANQNSTSF